MRKLTLDDNLIVTITVEPVDSDYYLTTEGCQWFDQFGMFVDVEFRGITASASYVPTWPAAAYPSKRLQDYWQNVLTIDALHELNKLLETVYKELSC